MKLRLIIEKKGRWQFRLHVAPQLPGAYYATLRSLGGARLDRAPIIGPFCSLDLVSEQADTIYQRLVDMHASASLVPEPGAGQLCGLSDHLDSGHAGIDRLLE